MQANWVGLGAIALALAAPAVASAPQDGTGAYATGRYRNLFAEQLGASPDASHAKIERAFQHLFHGDGQEQRV
jgi:oligosaccharide reducing-end xylanase